MRLDHAVAGELLERFVDAYLRFDGDDWVALFAEHAEVHEDPFQPPVVGHNEIRRALLEAAAHREQVEFTVERHWVVPPTVLAAWHASHVHRESRARVRVAGFLALELTAEGLIEKARYWSVRRERAT